MEVLSCEEPQEEGEYRSWNEESECCRWPCLGRRSGCCLGEERVYWQEEEGDLPSCQWEEGEVEVPWEELQEEEEYRLWHETGFQRSSEKNVKLVYIISATYLLNSHSVG